MTWASDYVELMNERLTLGEWLALKKRLHDVSGEYRIEVVPYVPNDESLAISNIPAMNAAVN